MYNMVLWLIAIKINTGGSGLSVCSEWNNLDPTSLSIGYDVVVFWKGNTPLFYRMLNLNRSTTACNTARAVLLGLLM